MCLFLFLREKEGLFYGQMVRRFEKKCKFLFFFSRLLFCRIFLRDGLRDGLRDARGAERKSGQNFYGEEKLGGWDFVGPGTSHFLLGTRYARERGFIFYFCFYLLIYFCFFFSKGFNQILMYCPKKKKEKKEEKEREPAVEHRMIGSNRSVFDF